MRLSPEKKLQLMALADGELEGDARERAERLASESEEGRRWLAAMRSSPLGALLGEGMAERAAAAAADSIVDAVMVKVHANATVGPEIVVRLPYSTQRGTSFGSRKPILVASALSALALAAGLALYIRSRDVLEPVGGSTVTSMPSIATGPAASAQPRPVTSQSAKALAQEGAWPPAGVQVDAIDSPSRDVHVFPIPAASASVPNASSVVIMIEDEPGATQ
jgi:hypothetical protein